ncbi:MAG: hypothetical protein IPG04_38565 [Polyangiaceae bacterium]|nr:hypothetical protein [Polyangiaceae bacterium]
MCGRTEQWGVRDEVGGQPPIAARPREVGHIPRAARAPRPHPEGWEGDATSRDPDVRGQGAGARSRDAVVGRLRAGLSGLLVRLRPGRSAQQALSVLQAAAVNSAGGWAIEVDIRKFFDSVDHAVLREVLRRRVRDGVILRLIGKWLNAGVLEDGAVSASTLGRLKGGVISPMLANILLHEVLDAWFQDEVKPRLRGQGTLVRYADDAVMMFSDGSRREACVRRLAEAIRQVRTHTTSEKTKLVAFERPDRPYRTDRDDGPGPCALEPSTSSASPSTEARPRWEVAGTDTNIQEPLQRTLKAIATWCQMHRHHAIGDQQRALNQKLRGHYAYFGRRGTPDASGTCTHAPLERGAGGYHVDRIERRSPGPR